MAKHRGDSSKMGKPDLCPKQPQVGCMCKLSHKLLEPLMRSVKLGTLREWRRHNLVRQLEKGATRRDFQRWKPPSMFLKRALRNYTKAKEGSLG
ncbi:hypothetical protein B296_00047838 [Ensete ventricosum]|uniref:Uncharacterized protein n=1 Tax=Ensete ventricosum TaxID=4639 RepID=A0A426YXN5_ENSVE|nr:hypothetical protein B296_00047838 [Ensete ventricosum]